jgi:autotransporter-associated beta strand protein
MKCKLTSVIVLVAVILAAGAPPALADVSATWNKTSGTNTWATGANWVGGSAATGNTGVATFGNSTYALTGNATVTAGTQTIAQMLFSNGSSNAYNWTVSGGTLDMSGATIEPTISVTNLGTGGLVTISSALKDSTAKATSASPMLKTGTGTLVIGSANNTGMVSGSYFAIGTSSTPGGVVDLTASGALGSANVVVNTGGALQLGCTTASTQYGMPLTLNGMGVSNDGALRVISTAGNQPQYTGAITLTANSRINNDHATGATGMLTINSVPTGAYNLTIGGTGDTSLYGTGGFNTGSLTKDGTGTLQCTKANSTFTGPVNITNGTLAMTVPTALGTGGTVTVSGNGTLQLGNSGTFSNSLVLSGSGVSNVGALRMSNASPGALVQYAGTISLAGNAQINNDYSNATTVPYAPGAFGLGLFLTNPNGITDSGTDAVTFNGGNGTSCNFYTTVIGSIQTNGGFIKSGVGTLALASAPSNTAGANFTLSGGTLAMLVNGTGGNVPAAVTNCGNGAGWTPAQVANLLGNGTFSSGTVDIDLTGGSWSDGGTAIAPSAKPINLMVRQLDASPGTGPFNTLTLTTANNYTGTTTVSVGILNIQNGDALGPLGTSQAANGVTVGNQTNTYGNLCTSTLQLQGGITVNKYLSVIGPGAVTSSHTFSVDYGSTTVYNGALQSVSGNNTWSGPITATPANAKGAGIGATAGTLNLSGSTVTLGSNTAYALNLYGAGNINISDNISGQSMLNVAMMNTDGTGYGTVTLTGANSGWTGQANVCYGTLEAANPGALPAYNVAYSTGYTGIGVGAQGTLAVNVGGASDWTSSQVDTLWGNANFALGGALGLDTTNASFTYATNLTNSNMGVAKLGPNTLLLTGSNSYTGGTTVKGGTLQLGNASALGGPGSLTVNAGTLDLNGFTPANAFTSLNGTGGLITDNSAGSSTTTLTVTVPSGNSATYAGSINDGATQHLALTINGAGTQVLSGVNNYSGPTTVSSGILQATNVAALPGYNVASQISVAAAGTLAVNVGGASDWTASQVDTLRSKVAFSPNATLGFDTTNGSFAYGSNIANAIGLNKLGANTLTLSGANSYTGTTTVTNGTLQATNAGALPGYNVASQISVASAGTLAVNYGGGSDWTSGQVDALMANASFSSGATLAFDTTNAGSGASYGSAIGSVGTTAGLAVTKLGPNTLTLTGANTYSGTTTISGGTLQLGDGTTNGSIAGASIVNNAALAFNVANATNSTYAGVISGGGTVTMIGAGTMTLTGANTYSGTTTISGGTLQLGDGTNNGSIAGTSIVNNAALAFNVANATNSTYAGTISGGGTVAMIGAGTMIFSGANSYSGTTTISNGTLQLGDGTHNGSIAGTSIVNNAALAFNVASATNSNYAGAISGGGTVAMIGAGTMILSGANSYSGTTTISSGTLQLGNGTNNGSIAGTSIVDNAALAFNVASATNSNYAGAISGGGTVTMRGAGTMILSGNNSAASGNVTVTSGTLEATNPNALPGFGDPNDSYGSNVAVGPTGTLAINYGGPSDWTSYWVDVLTGNASFSSGATLAFDTTNASSGASYSTLYNATGLAVEKLGPNTLTLPSATYSGLTTVNGGTLQLGVNAQAQVLGSGAAGADIQSQTAKLIFDYVSGSDPYSTIKGLLNSQIYSSGAGVNPLVCFDNTTADTVTVESTIAGDANLDGTVDINDLTIVLANYNQTGMTWTQGEFTGDGTVDINDLTIVLANYNQTIGSSAAGAIKAVPEPCTLALLAAGLAGLLACGAWRKRR